MKKTTKVLALLATALMAFAVVGCKNPGSDPKPQPENNPVVIFESEAGLELDWSYTIIDASKIAKATDASVLEVECSKCADDYQVMQICFADDTKIAAGTITGATLDTGDIKNLTGASFTYKPSSLEWTRFKADGIRFQGHGYTVTKITLK